MNPPAPLAKPDPYVVARVLEKLWRGGLPMLRTRLQVASNVNYDIFRKYLSWMLDKGLVEMHDGDDGHERVALTPKGEATYGQLIRWVDDFMHMRD